MSTFTTGFDTLNEESVRPEQFPPGPFLKEKSDSPEIEFAEQCTITHTFESDWETALSLRVPRGTFLTDSQGNITRILSCKIQHGAGNIGIVTMVAESISFAVPPDDFDIDPVENNPSLFKLPKYYNNLTDLDRANIQAALDLPQELARTEASVAGNPYDPASTQYALFNQLLSKLRKGEDSFYATGLKVTWSQYSFSPQLINIGSYIEDPTTILPFSYYIGPSGNIFPPGMSWLRLCDAQPFNRTWFRHTMTWIGFPNAHFDPDIYSN